MHEMQPTDPKTVVVTSQKGGTGKTTLVHTLAVAAKDHVSRFQRVGMIDSDPQGSLTSWYKRRNQTSPLLAHVGPDGLPATLHELHQHGAAITFIDTPPSVHAFVTDYLANADFVLIPVKASPHDLASVSDTLALVHQAGVPFAFVLNQAKPNTKMLTEALTALSEHGPIAKPVIHDRSEFAASAIQGSAVTETAPKAKAGQEAKELCSYLLNKLYDGPATDAEES